jgi:hypothetical protein
MRTRGLQMTEKALTSPGILAIAFAFAVAGLVGYAFVITHPEAAHLARWAHAPISTATR